MAAGEAPERLPWLQDRSWPCRPCPGSKLAFRRKNRSERCSIIRSRKLSTWPLDFSRYSLPQTLRPRPRANHGAPDAFVRGSGMMSSLLFQAAASVRRAGGPFDFAQGKLRPTLHRYWMHDGSPNPVLLPSKAMTSRLGLCLRNPLFLLCLAAGLLAFVVQSGELGTADTMHRLQATHWLWTSQPQVFPSDYPEFGLHGRGGQLYAWYGIGQSLLMLPADLMASWIAHWSIFSDYEDDPQIRAIVVSYLTGILVNLLTALVGFRLLRQLRFSVRESVLGLLALMFCTTHLHYTQNMEENNYIMLLTLTGFSFQYEWLRTGSRRALFAGSAALGLNLLTRLTTGLDLVAAGVFLLLVLWLEQGRGRELWRRFLPYCRVAAPVYAVFLLGDRLYQFYRFGS